MTRAGMYCERIKILFMQPFCRSKIWSAEQVEIFNGVFKEYSSVCTRLLHGIGGSKVESLGYDWTDWAGSIRSAFSGGVPLNFLANPIISSTMVFARNNGIQLTKFFISNIVGVFGEKTAIKLLKEDYIGLPNISNMDFMTSANRAHHANHLAYFTKATLKNIWESEVIVEWGGGYGNMARIIRRLNPKVTYVIIDLPELLALQYVYLSSVESRDCVHVVAGEGFNHLELGKINLITQELFSELLPSIECDGFISTWAISESPKAAQEFVYSNNFFGAKNILIGSLVNKNNFLSYLIGDIGFIRQSLSVASGVGDDHEYWFK